MRHTHGIRQLTVTGRAAARTLRDNRLFTGTAGGYHPETSLRVCVGMFVFLEVVFWVCFVFVLLLDCHSADRILVPQPGTKTRPTAVKAWTSGLPGNPLEVVFWKQWLVCLAVRSSLSLPDGTQDTQLEREKVKGNEAQVWADGNGVEITTVDCDA